jgi:hypothetical protein
MRFVVIDLEGSTVDAFDTRKAAVEAIRVWVRSDASLGDELSVIEYLNGDRIGNPQPVLRFADEYLSRSPFVLKGMSIPDPKIEIETKGGASAEFVVIGELAATDRADIGAALLRRIYGRPSRDFIVGSC